MIPSAVFWRPGNPDTTLLRGNYSTISKSLNNWSLIIDQIKSDQRIKAISPTVQGTALIRSSGKNLSVQVKGIQLVNADQIYDLSSRLTEGKPIVEGNSILIGTKLSDDLGVSSGNSVNLFTANGDLVPFLIGGVFDLQNESANGSLVFMDLKRAQKLFPNGERDYGY